MYRVKITHCAPIIENIYGKGYLYICKDEHDTWIEVKTEAEAKLINNIENLQYRTFFDVQKLTELKNS